MGAGEFVLNMTDVSSAAASHSAPGQCKRCEHVWKFTAASGILERAVGMRAGSSSSRCILVNFVRNVGQQILVAAGGKLMEVDRPNKYGTTPLTMAIESNKPDCAEFLLHSGAQLKNVKRDRKIPDWILNIETRRNVTQSLIVFLGVLRRRFQVPGAATAHIGNRLPRDMVSLIALHAWNTRLDPRWLTLLHDTASSKRCLLC